MSRLNAFVKKLKSSQVEAKPEAKPQVDKQEPIKSAYVARRPHAKTQKRNELFAEFITSPEAIELIKDVKNTQKLKALVNAFKEKYSEPMPLVAAYSIFNQVQNEK